MTMVLADVQSPREWEVRGIDGRVRGMVQGTVSPLDAGEGSWVTVAVDFEGRGLGKLLVPLIVRRQTRAELSRNMRKLKELLENGRDETRTKGAGEMVARG